MSSEEKLNLEIMTKDTSSKASPLVESKDPTPIQFFECCNKRRIVPKTSELGGLILTITLIVIPSICFFFFAIFIAIEYKRFSFSDFIANIVGVIISFITFLLTLYCLWDISTSCPGYQESPKMSMNQFKEEAPTKTIRNALYTLKYCETCCIVRDIRTFHCRICNKCVEKQDHHCGFVANCIGKDNILKFLAFMMSIVIHCLVLGSFTGFNIYSVVVTYKEVLNSNWLLAFIIIELICVFFMFIAGSMGGQLIVLISRNQTTNEQIRNKYDNTVFNNGWKQNWKEATGNK